MRCSAAPCSRGSVGRPPWPLCQLLSASPAALRALSEQAQPRRRDTGSAPAAPCRRSLASSLGGAGSEDGASVGTLTAGSQATWRAAARQPGGQRPAAGGPFASLFPDVPDLQQQEEEQEQGQPERRAGEGGGASPQALLFGDVQLPPEAWEEAEEPAQKQEREQAPTEGDAATAQ